MLPCRKLPSQLEAIASRWLCYDKQIIGLCQAKNRAKALRKSGESIEKVGRKHWESHLTPTVLHVHNGRYKHEQRQFSMFITVDAAWLSQGFCPIFLLLSPNLYSAFAQRKHPPSRTVASVSRPPWDNLFRFKALNTPSTVFAGSPQSGLYQWHCSSA